MIYLGVFLTSDTDRIVQLKCSKDNYVYVILDESLKSAVCVDPTESGVVEKFLTDSGFRLLAIWNTHHHFDHIDGNLKLKEKYACQVITSVTDLERIPGATHGVKNGDTVSAGGLTYRVLEIPGHTRGHIAFWSPIGNILFCGDTLFTLGCGRVFEGTFDELFRSLQILKALPDQTLVYTAHEYGRSNARFAKSLLPTNERVQLRSSLIERMSDTGSPTTPSILRDEKTTNPFLLADTLDQFICYRENRNRF